MSQATTPSRTRHASKGLLADISIEDLRRRTETEPYRKLWQRLVAFSRDMIARAQRNGGAIGYGAVGNHSLSTGVVEAALVWRLTGDKDSLAYVEHCIELLAAAYGPDSPLKTVAMKATFNGIPYHSHAEVPLATDICREALSPHSIDTLYRVLREHVIDKNDGGSSLYVGSGCNIPAVQNIDSAVAALTWGEESGHPNWQRVVELGRDSTVAYFRRGLDDKGYPFEGPAYASGTADHLYRYAQLLRQRGIEDIFAAEPNTERFADALLSFVFPDRSCFGNINDVGLRSPWSLPYLLLTARYFNRPDHLGLWHEFQGPDHPERPYGDAMPAYEKKHDIEWTHGCAPSSLLHTFLWWDAAEPWVPVAKTKLPLADYSPGTETAVFRTSWSRDAVYANFLGTGRSKVSSGHIHSETGHFAIVAYGDYLAIDTGRYNVDEDQHNTVLIDGKCFLPTYPKWGASLRSGRLANFQRHALLEYAMADMAAMKNCIWAERHFLFVRTGETPASDSCYTVVIDNVNKDHGKFGLTWQMHVNPDSRLEITGASAAKVTGPNARLDVNFFVPSPEDFPSDPHKLELRIDEQWWAFGEDPGSGAAKFGLDASSVHRPRLLAELTGLNGQIIAVISPRRNSEAPLAVREFNARRVKRIEIDHGDFTDTLIAALDHHFIKLPDVEGFTELALIRRRRSGELVGVWTVDGRALKLKPAR